MRIDRDTRIAGYIVSTADGYVAAGRTVDEVGRLLSHGSDSVKGAEFTATLYSVVGTLSMNGIDVPRWLEAWLTACAKNGGKPPHDLSPWLPWSMSEERRRKFTAPE